MKINVEIDENREDIEIIIKAPEINDNINLILEKLSDEKPKIIIGYEKQKAKIIKEDSIVRIYTANKKVFVVTKEVEYLIKIPLYEALERLSQNNFIRISNTEIVNIQKIIEFDLSFTGTICIKLSNGDVSYVSRRYLSEIKRKLGIGRYKDEK